VSLLTRPKPEAELKELIWNKESLSLLPEQRKQQMGLRNPFIWWAVITAIVLFFYVKYA
jgi:SSS family solute:Na+ symporter